MKERLTEEEKKRRHRAAVKRWKADNPEKDAQNKKRANANFRAKNPDYWKGCRHAMRTKQWKVRNPERTAEHRNKQNYKQQEHLRFIKLLEIASLICKLSTEHETMKPKTTHEHND